MSWNVNGIRAAGRNGFLNSFEKMDADVVAIQESKATVDQLDETLKHPLGYHSHWFPAAKAGYSGVAIYSKTEPLDIALGIGVHAFDSEGRVIIAKYREFTLINAYFPNSRRDHSRLPYKLEFATAIAELCRSHVARGENVILCGDYNVAHEEIDLKNPKTNRDNAGFLPAERAWMTDFLASGFVDSFRHFNRDPGNYTWWSYRPGVRDKNIGWRLDYHCVNAALLERVADNQIHCEIRGSDHCPVAITLKL